MSEHEEDLAEQILKKMQNKNAEKSLGTFRMVYEDSAGEKTERMIDIIRFVVTERKRSVYAYCHLRRTMREFSFKGVKQLFDGEQEIENPQDFLLSLKTSADDMADIANRLVWTKELTNFYEDAIVELRDIKQRRYVDMLRNNVLLDLWEPFF